MESIYLTSRPSLLFIFSVTVLLQHIGKCIAEELRKQGALVEVIDKQEGLGHLLIIKC